MVFIGQVLVIFKTKEAADKVMSELLNGCLVLGDGRYVHLLRL